MSNKDIEYQIQHGLDLGIMSAAELLVVIEKLRMRHRNMCQNVLLFIEKTKKERGSLLADRKMLRALEAAGVDNWEGYSHALETL
jgi:cobalamin-dependent methionine synthase I